MARPLLVCVTLTVFLGACGDAVQSVAIGEEPRAITLCETVGWAFADSMSEDVQGIEAVFETTNGELQEWARTRHRGMTSPDGVPAPEPLPTDWQRRLPEDTDLAICYYNAAEVFAPSGPANTNPGGPPDLPYDQLVLVVTELGEVFPYIARKEGKSQAPEAPPQSRRLR